MSKQLPDDPQPWQTLESEYLHRETWLTIRRDKVKLSNGRTIDDYYVQEFPEWINVLAITKERKAVLIRQYRHGLGSVDYELPAGVCEPDESPLEAAQRELLEETGYSGGAWSPLMTLSPNPALQNNLSYSFLAEGVTLSASQHLDPTEEITVHEVPLDDLRNLIFEGEIIQALHAAPVLKYLMQQSIP
ncbi:NUDIX hydrolase [Chlorobaculum parvum NCIB 8327]|uniref:GDP-mannose pyrophosphatase n=1 Tax=Chlorobaculum parvum (strain DSM 263 / NCIMB 8327) TaxID=517417 RepID=B3QMQ6_CHLP8|nr:NUDIX hydrolase [Chlorobaculum parvum]ACF11209.1 NUDIX hydrolase [Chlorobaculum parvum NCIB 8327]